MPDTINLKKYANRRLYDTDRSRYVTLEEVAEMIRDGHTIVAEDAKTGEDVTAFILTQIVLEHARKKNTLMPASLLHLLIRYGDNLLVEFFDKHLEQTMNKYMTYKSRMDEEFKRWMNLGANMTENANPFSFFTAKKEKSNKDNDQ